MTDKEKIRAEIERQIPLHHSGYLVCLKNLLSFINSLPEEHKFNIGDTIRDQEDSEFTFHINKIEDGKYIEKDDALVMIGEALVENQWKPVPKVKPTGALKELLDNIDEKELEETRKEMMKEAEREELKNKGLEEVFGHMADAYYNDVLMKERQTPENIAHHCRLSYFRGLKAGANYQKQQDCRPVSKDLEEAADEYSDRILSENRGKCNPDWNTYADGYEQSICAHVYPAFIDGAQWQKQQIMKEVYTGIYDCDDDTSWIGFKGWLLSTSKIGNKVKFIIIEEE